MLGEWTADGDVQRARVGGRLVAEYRSGLDVPAADSPRPYLHAVRSLGGAVVTDVRPADHPHHLGASVAVADVDGVSYWGGRTFVRDAGPTLLDNHGTQRRSGLTVRDDALHETLTWRDTAGRAQLEERRHVRARGVPFGDRDAVAVELRSTLTAADGGVSIGSPATNGRPGAAYGGPFWRLPARPGLRVLTPDGEGEERAHGAEAAWVALVTEEVSVVFRQPGAARPWFVRAAEYPGVGVSLATAERVAVLPGEPLRTGLAAIVVDGAVEADEVREVLG